MWLSVMCHRCTDGETALFITPQNSQPSKRRSVAPTNAILLATVFAGGLTMISPASAQGLDDQAGAGDPYPTPGTVTVHLNGRVRFYADFMPDNKQATTPTIAASNTASATNGNTTNGTGVNKAATYGFQTYIRLYPSFDGVSANGLKYGAAMEIREGSANAADSGSAGSIGSAGGGTAGSISSQDIGRSTLFVRRAYGYFGTAAVGTIRVGATDGPTSLYETGTFENWADGGFNGDMYMEMPGFQQLQWPFSAVGNEYTTIKAVYLSPQFLGFDGGVSFEPTTAGPGTGTGQGASSCATVNVGCDLLDSTPTYESQRRRNTIEALLRYRGTFGPMGVAVTAAYITSDHVADDGTPKRPVQFQGLDQGDGGLAVTYGGLTVGGHILAGTGNQSFTLQKQNAKPELAYLGGASYAIGPAIVGVQYVNVMSEGSNGNLTTGVDTTGQRSEQGIALGGTYAVAPGFALFTEYYWDQRKEGGYDFVSGATDAAHNKVTGQLFGVGASFAW